MNRLDGARKIYEATQIPENLGQVVDAAIREGERRRLRARRGQIINMSKRTNNNLWKAAACMAGIVLAGSIVAVNTSEAAAATLGNLPVIGGLARILTVRDYSYQDEDKEIKAEIPGIIVEEETQGQENTAQIDMDYVERMNVLIEQTVNEYTQAAEEHIAEYKKAFLETGGTEEEFAEKNIKVDVLYDVKYESDSVVSFVLTANESWSNAYGVQYFYNLDLEDGRAVTLEDLLGPDYAAIANEQIISQMKERMAQDSSVTYWFGDSQIEGFTSVDENTSFYINEAGNPVVVFEKYEVAPGAMGRPEFEIK